MPRDLEVKSLAIIEPQFALQVDFDQCAEVGLLRFEQLVQFVSACVLAIVELVKGSAKYRGHSESVRIELQELGPDFSDCRIGG